MRVFGTLTNKPKVSNIIRTIAPIGIAVYIQTSNISPTLVGNKIVDYSDVVGVSSVGAAPTTSSFST